MKLDKRIIQWFSVQEHLFAVFVLLELIPNYILFFTESYPVTIRIASLMIPLGSFAILFSVFKRPGVMFWTLFIKFLLDALQLVLLYLFGSSIIAVDMFLNLTTTNPTEAGELMSNIWIPVAGSLLLYVPAFFLATYSIKLQETLSKRFRLRSVAVGITLFLAGWGIALIPMTNYHSFAFHKDIYPANIIYNQYFALNKYIKTLNHAENARTFSFQATRSTQSKEQEIIILMVGETSRAISWGLYNKELNTTPRLAKRKSLIHFTDVLTQATVTHKSVPIILSAACAENFDVIYKQKSVISAFKEAGFKTVAFSNQQPNHSFLDDFYNEAEEYKNYYLESKEVHVSFKPDGIVLDDVKKVLEKEKEDLFIYIHGYGSHFNYKERYPKEFSVYKPDDLKRISELYRPEMLNAYNNSILYTDYVIDSLASMLESKDCCSSLIYLSDHGEDLFDDDRDRYLHASPTPTFYQLYIPMVAWFSEKYRTAFPVIFDNAQKHQQSPISTNSIFHTLLDMGQINTPYKDSTLAITNKHFESRKRFFLDDHDQAIEISRSGLKKCDFEMFKKWNIDY